jgi:phage gp29-like protein
VPSPKVVVDRSQAEALGLSDGDIDAIIATSPNLYADGPINIITKCDSQIASAFLTQFADLGNTETGARSVGEIHLSVFRRAAINLCDIVAAQVSGIDRRGGGTIGRLIRWNYGAIDPSKLPKLTHTGLDTDDLADSMGMLPGLVQSGLLTPDDELERALRERLGAGDLPEDAQRSPMTRIAASGGGGGIAALSEQLIARRRAKNG